MIGIYLYNENTTVPQILLNTYVSRFQLVIFLIIVRDLSCINISSQIKTYQASCYII